MGVVAHAHDLVGREVVVHVARVGEEQVAAQLAADLGFDPVDAGPLQVARYTEPFALLIAGASVPVAPSQSP